MDKVLNTDVVVWATPIYYYEMSGQMKTLIDRTNPMYSQDYKFRELYMLSTAAEDEEWVPKRAESGLTGWIDSYPKCELKGILFCGGVDAPRTIEGNTKLQKAYEMGKNSWSYLYFISNLLFVKQKKKKNRCNHRFDDCT